MVLTRAAVGVHGFKFRSRLDSPPALGGQARLFILLKTKPL